MGPTLDQTDRRLMPVGRNVLRLFAPALLAVALLTVAASVPAGAHDPRVKKPGAPTAVTATAMSEGAAVSWTAPVFAGGSLSPATR